MRTFTCLSTDENLIIFTSLEIIIQKTLKVPCWRKFSQLFEITENSRSIYFSVFLFSILWGITLTKSKNIYVWHFAGIVKEFSNFLCYLLLLKLILHFMGNLENKILFNQT